jgi:hypothetical protein
MVKLFVRGLAFLSPQHNNGRDRNDRAFPHRTRQFGHVFSLKQPKVSIRTYREVMEIEIRKRTARAL